MITDLLHEILICLLLFNSFISFKTIFLLTRVFKFHTPIFDNDYLNYCFINLIT